LFPVLWWQNYTFFTNYHYLCFKKTKIGCVSAKKQVNLFVLRSTCTIFAQK